jgi:hypothetical protein
MPSVANAIVGGVPIKVHDTRRRKPLTNLHGAGVLPHPAHLGSLLRFCYTNRQWERLSRLDISGIVQFGAASKDGMTATTPWMGAYLKRLA